MRETAFRAVWLGQTASLFGDQVTGLALPWLILLQTHSALDAGLIAAVRYLPLILFGLPAGVLADREDILERRALMIAADVLRALSLALVALIGILGRMPALVLLAGVVTVLGMGQLLFQTAYRAWLPELTGEGRLSRATAALEAADAASVLAGYPLAGALIAATGPVTALGADALSYLISAATLLSVNTHGVGAPEPPTPKRVAPSPSRSRQSPGPSALRADATQSRSGAASARRHARPLSVNLRVVGAQTLEGVHVIVATPVQRFLKGTGATLYAVAGALTVLVAALTQLRLHLPAWQAGFVFGAMGVGGLLGSALAPRLYDWGWRCGLALTFGACVAGLLALAAACEMSPGWGFIVALVADALTDGSLSLAFVLVGTATTLVTPPGLRGRVNAAGSIFSSAIRAFSVVGAGALSVGGNPLPAFVALAGCSLAAALAAARHPSGALAG